MTSSISQSQINSNVFLAYMKNDVAVSHVEFSMLIWLQKDGSEILQKQLKVSTLVFCAHYRKDRTSILLYLLA